MGESLKALAEIPYRTMLIAQIPFFLIEAKGIYETITNFIIKTANLVLTRFTVNRRFDYIFHKVNRKITDKN